jgi:DNA-binding NarL/FixJ family response regulator
MKKIKVLVVDDEALFRESIKIYLENQPEIELVGLVENGEKCLAFANQNPCELALIDARMPGLDGIQTTQKLKKNFPNVKVIIFTAFPEEVARNYATKAGADDYFLKGNPLYELLQKIRSLFF